MADAMAKRTVEEMRAELAGFLSELDVEEVEPYDEKDSRGFTMKFGGYPILIVTRNGSPSCRDLPGHGS